MRRSIIGFIFVVVCLNILGTKAKAADTNKYPKTIVAEAESNNHSNEAMIISPNEKIIGAISGDSDYDYYLFCFPEDGLLTIDFSGDTTDDLYILRVYDETNNIIIDDYITIKNKWPSYTLNFKKGSALLFKLFRFRPGYDEYVYSDRVDNYELFFHFDNSITDWGFENNNNKDNATPLTCKKYDNCLGEDEGDYYVYTPNKNGYVYFTIKSEDGKSLQYNTQELLFVINENSGMYARETEVSETEVVYGNYLAKKGVPMYICVTFLPFSSYSIEPTLKTTFIETEGNNSYSDANKIKLNKDCCGMLNESTDVDYYKFTANKTGKIKLNFNMEMLFKELGYKVTILDSKNKKVASTEFTKDGSLKFKVKKGKRYYVRINQEDYWGTWRKRMYKFKIVSK